MTYVATAAGETFSASFLSSPCYLALSDFCTFLIAFGLRSLLTLGVPLTCLWAASKTDERCCSILSARLVEYLYGPEVGKLRCIWPGIGLCKVPGGAEVNKLKIEKVKVSKSTAENLVFILLATLTKCRCWRPDGLDRAETKCVIESCRRTEMRASSLDGCAQG